ncbi:hypothetical protein [Mesorhizobium sp. M0296]|uniref:hypothetical protein n=1 Tax=Mesorhizobium sp. M0296 TaxID=2956931 RepID=UPI003337D290
MNKLLVGAALLAAGVFGVDTYFVSYIRSSVGMAAFAQEAQATSPDAGASGGFGNSGAAMGSGGSSDQPSAGDEPASGSAPVTESPDAAATVGTEPAAVGTTDQSTDTEAAPEEPAAAAAAATAITTTTSGDAEAIAS